MFKKIALSTLFLTFCSFAKSQEVQPVKQLDFMVGNWEVEAKIRNSPISYIEGSGTMEVYFEKDTLYADMDIKFQTFRVQGTTKRVYNQQKKAWEISWNPKNQPVETGIEGKFKNGRFIELNYGQDFHSPFVGRLVVYDISNDHFSVRKDRIYDDGIMMNETWVYEANRKD